MLSSCKNKTKLEATAEISLCNAELLRGLCVKKNNKQSY